MIALSFCETRLQVASKLEETPFTGRKCQRLVASQRWPLVYASFQFSEQFQLIVERRIGFEDLNWAIEYNSKVHSGNTSSN